MTPAAYTYETAAKALGLRGDKALRTAVRKKIIRARRVGHRTLLIPREQLAKWAGNRGLKLA